MLKFASKYCHWCYDDSRPGFRVFMPYMERCECHLYSIACVKLQAMLIVFSQILLQQFSGFKPPCFGYGYSGYQISCWDWFPLRLHLTACHTLLSAES